MTFLPQPPPAGFQGFVVAPGELSKPPGQKGIPPCQDQVEKERGLWGVDALGTGEFTLPGEGIVRH